MSDNEDVRYIGNKTKLLDEIEALVGDRCPSRGTLLDIFAGTASVAARFRSRGWTVFANDRMRVSWVRQVALLEGTEPTPELRARLRALGEAPDAEALVSRQFSPAGAAGRRFFTEAHARRLDAALERLTAWRLGGEIDEPTLCWLLCAVIEAADRVANISGTYGAFLKTWQPNTHKPLVLRPPEPVAGPRGRAFRRDANELVREIDCDVLYIDPPYNGREYCANYHVIEAIAERPFQTDLAAFEATIYGKSGLRPYERSAYCDPRRCAGAFRDLIAGCRARHVVVSYNEEGILSRAEIESALCDGLGTRRVDFRPILYKRFRSDADRAGRSYKVLAGRGRDEIAEWLLHASAAAPRPAASASARPEVA